MGVQIDKFISTDGKEYRLDELFNHDELSNALTTISFPHHQIHEGVGYTVNRVVTLPLGGLANILIVTPNTVERMHFTYQVVSDSLMTLGLYEAPDYAGGGALVAYNRDRDSVNTSDVVLTSDATDSGSGLGTLIWPFSAGANKTVTASEGGQRNEFILGRNQKYLMLCTGVQNDIVTFLLDWYERAKEE